MMKQCAPDHGRENDDFVRFLKTSEITGEQLDAFVQQVFSDCAKEMDCTKCANCCKEASPHLDREDVRRIAKRVHRTQADFKRLFLIRDVDFGDYAFTQKPCPLLEKDRCIVYPDHPQECREYPHLDKPGFISRLVNIIENYPVCPIVFRVLERLKAKIWKK